MPTARGGRPSKCGGCGKCRRCKEATHRREQWRGLTLDQKRAVIAKRDPEKARAAERASYARNRKERRAKGDAYARTKAGRAVATRSLKAQRKRNPIKNQARERVRYALKTGKLVKGPCEHANADCDGKIHAHHDDYDKPLDVRWLCRFHHSVEHAPKTERPGGTGRSGTT
jgi:hypothetical protein